MKKSTPLAVFAACLNRCFSFSDCSKCSAYNIEYHTCKYSNAHAIFSDAYELLLVYSKEHAKIDCRECNITGKHDTNSACVYNHTKILNKLKHG